MVRYEKTKIKGWTAYREGHRFNSTVTLMDGRRIRLYSGTVDSVSEGEKDISRQVEKYNAGIAEEIERRKGIYPLGEYVERYLDRLQGRKPCQCRSREKYTTGLTAYSVWSQRNP